MLHCAAARAQQLAEFSTWGTPLYGLRRVDIKRSTLGELLYRAVQRVVALQLWPQRRRPGLVEDASL